VPVFLTIPWLNGLPGFSSTKALANGSGRQLLTNSAGVEANGADDLNGAMVAINGETNGAVAPWDEEHSLHPYADGLRDRLVTFFELKGLKHKPKLIAMSSCSKGAGVTTLAAGLAASLSETGEGNVLLVDLNTGRGSAHPFYRGKPSCGLADLLEGDKGTTAAKVQDNLYLVHAGGADDRLTKVMPKQLAHLLPKLQQTDYDYIIFDMPPITQTSVTPRLAGFMDMVFMVVEAEKTNRDWLKQASGLLKQSNTNVAAVFNKRRQYTPNWLHQEF
jgi:Mrp family chromosome partitioning ATPase